MSASVNRRIFGAAVVVGAMTIITKVVGFLKDIAIAYHFGANDALDAFYIALLLPNMVQEMIARALRMAFVPVYVEIREKEGEDAASRLLSGVLTLGIVLLAAISVVLAALSPVLLPLLGSSFGPDKLALTQYLFLILVLSMLVGGMSLFLSSVINVYERFALPAISPGIVSLMMVVCLVILGHLWGIYALALGMVIGYFLQVIALAWQLSRLHVTLRPKWYGFTAPMKDVIGQFIPRLAGAFLMSNTDLVDGTMAAMLGSGSVAMLMYGKKVIALVLGLLSMSIGTAVVPHFSQMVATRNWNGVLHTLRTYLSLILIVTIPVSIGLFFVSEPIVALIFQRGAFTSDDVEVVGQVQAMYALQIPFYVVSIVVARLMATLKENKIMMIVAGINLIANILFNLIFMRLFGLAGIALSTSAVYFVSLAITSIFLYRRIKRERSFEQP
jgi:putative peptidoglycan lipid II flippase